MTPRTQTAPAESDYDWEALFAEARVLMETRRAGTARRYRPVVARAEGSEALTSDRDLRHPNDVAVELGLDRSTITRWAQLGVLVRYYTTAARGRGAPYFVDLDACRAHVAKRRVKSRPKRTARP
jgi:hypothetical protein